MKASLILKTDLEELKAKKILFPRFSFIDEKIILLNEAIAELETPKTCETCSKYIPWKCTDGSVLSVGDCSYGIRYGKEIIDEQYEWFVPEDFGCNEYTPKDTP